MVSGVEKVSPAGGSRGGRRVVINRSFLRCRRVRGSSRGGSTPPPLLLPRVLSLLPGLDLPDRGVPDRGLLVLGWTAGLRSAVGRWWYRPQPAASAAL